MAWWGNALFANSRRVLKCTREMRCQLVQWSAADETNSYGRLLDAMCRWRKKGRSQLSEAHHTRQLLRLKNEEELPGSAGSVRKEGHCCHQLISKVGFLLCKLFFFCSLLLIRLWISTQMRFLVNSDSVIFVLINSFLVIDRISRQAMFLLLYGWGAVRLWILKQAKLESWH